MTREHAEVLIVFPNRLLCNERRRIDDLAVQYRPQVAREFVELGAHGLWSEDARSPGASRCRRCPRRPGDCPYARGKDLRDRPFHIRPNVIEDVLDGQALLLPVRRLSDDGLKAWRQVVEHGWEGRGQGSERSLRRRALLRWLKVKQARYRESERAGIRRDRGETAHRGTDCRCPGSTRRCPPCPARPNPLGDVGPDAHGGD